MITVSLEEVFDLIKSLSKSEKRFFKLTVTTDSNSAGVSKLFDELEKSSPEEMIKPSKVITKLLKQKNILEEIYHIILKSQRTFYAESITAYTIKDEITNLRNLFDKAQYKQCRKMLNKTPFAGLRVAENCRRVSRSCISAGRSPFT